MEFEHVTFDLPHGTFHALQGGDPDGQPTIVLHGFPDHPPTAKPFLAELGRRGRHVVAPWLRGYAPSPSVTSCTSRPPRRSRNGLRHGPSNPVENLWLFMRENWLSNRIFKSYDNIVDHCCDAWRKLETQPWRIMSIGRRDWANGF